MLVGILNASTLIIAHPTMMVKLNTDLFGIMWVLISYTLLITILAPAWGRLAVLGLATMHYDTPHWILTVWMFVNSFGSGLFQAPNTSAIM